MLSTAFAQVFLRVVFVCALCYQLPFVDWNGDGLDTCLATGLTALALVCICADLRRWRRELAERKSEERRADRRRRRQFADEYLRSLRNGR